jgi:glutamine synthetase
LEQYLSEEKIADKVFVGPEPEFFVFDSVRYQNTFQHKEIEIRSVEGFFESARTYPDNNPNFGYQIPIKGGYVPLPPADTLHELRAQFLNVLTEIGHVCEVHHHEVGTAGQAEVGTKFGSLVRKADEFQEIKYVLKNVSVLNGKTLTFMPKPLVGTNGSGMHVHFSFVKDGENLFAGDKYAGLSETALFFIGGVIKHAKALNAFANPSVNSYRRLVPGFEAPVLLAYSAQNRSASIRIPYVANPKGARVEVRFPDPTANPYLCYTALILAGLDGIRKKIHPGEPLDVDLYELPEHELKKIPTVAADLNEALRALESDHEFLLQGDVFTKDTIEAYIALLQKDVVRWRMEVHPFEFERYYNC